MATHLTSSHEFASLVSKLQLAPEDPQLKLMIVKYLPQMMELAKTNPLALYHLAHIYSPSSAQYKQNMQQSADLGCTNAMLTLSQLLAKSGNFEEAAYYIQKIGQFEDTYILEHAQELLLEYPQLAKIIQEEQEKTSTKHHAHRFFTQPEKRSEGGAGNSYIVSTLSTSGCD